MKVFENQHIDIPFHNVTLDLKREDLNHEFISGNKLRKLKYNLEDARSKGAKTLLTFGGAFSNHIAAVSAAGVAYGFKTIGIIRGEELQDKINNNATLNFAQSQGMHLKFMSRSDYKEKTTSTTILKLQQEFGAFYLIPEGGTNMLAIKGCEEILTKEDADYHYICAPVGTGGTVSGLINSSQPHQYVLGFSSLKGDFLREEITTFVYKNNWELQMDYHFGGYAKINEDLTSFINQFKSDYNIQLDPIYTGKMMYGIFDLINKGYFKKGTRILAIHTGGLQGIIGMNKRLKKKNLPQIEL